MLFGEIHLKSLVVNASYLAMLALARVMHRIDTVNISIIIIKKTFYKAN